MSLREQYGTMLKDYRLAHDCVLQKHMFAHGLEHSWNMFAEYFNDDWKREDIQPGGREPPQMA